MTDYHNLPLIEEDPPSRRPDNASLNSSTSSSGGAEQQSHVGMTRFGAKQSASYSSESRFLHMPATSSRQNSSSSSSPLPPPPSFPAPRVSSTTNGCVSQERSGGRYPGTVSSSSMNVRQQQQQFPASGRRSAPLFEDPVRDVEREASRVLVSVAVLKGKCKAQNCYITLAVVCRISLH